MSELSAAILDVLGSVSAPMLPASLGKVLHVTGSVDSKGNPFSIEEIETALQELVAQGRIEKVRRHGSEAYRAIHSK